MAVYTTKEHVAGYPGVNPGHAHGSAPDALRDDPDDGVHAVDVLVGDLQGAAAVALKFKDRGNIRVPDRMSPAGCAFLSCAVGFLERNRISDKERVDDSEGSGLIEGKLDHWTIRILIHWRLHPLVKHDRNTQPVKDVEVLAFDFRLCSERRALCVCASVNSYAIMIMAKTEHL
ncbi:hypothetical protein EVAR_97805_1 [Eumeta japonica]|uniref:Uncharacterized protein n=1 Tax=Eumeta variegata TaxID=151549 RepID=A0A4C1XBS9_EUMVA|nr:hypothetical protein EVAR_97805_1 [Eumeta japonica]